MRIFQKAPNGQTNKGLTPYLHEEALSRHRSGRAAPICSGQARLIIVLASVGDNLWTFVQTFASEKEQSLGAPDRVWQGKAEPRTSFGSRPSIFRMIRSAHWTAIGNERGVTA